MQLTLALGAISLVGFALATPPACILNAMGVQGSDATDMKTLCDTKQKYVIGNMTENCSSDYLEPAYNYYSSSCLEAMSITIAALPTETVDNSSDNDDNDKSNGSDSDNSDGDEATDADSSNSNTLTNSAVTGVAPNSVFFAVSSLLVTGTTCLFFL